MTSILIRIVGLTSSCLAIFAFGVPLAQAASASTPAMPTGTGAYIKLIVAFVVILLIMVILFRLLGKRMGIQQRGTIQVIAARQLAPNRSVQVVELGERRYLIGVGENVQLLADVTDSYEIIHEEAGNSSFGQALQSAFADLRRNKPEDR